MSTLLMAENLSGARAASLRLYFHSSPESGGVYWRINGFRARLLVWTPQEWDSLDTRPLDAQFHPSGVWCALRLD
jgi:hypothetical protein